jgi:hypothetical protein
MPVMARELRAHPFDRLIAMESKVMNSGRRILIIAEPDLGRRLEAFLRESGWSTYRSPDIQSLPTTLSSVQPHLLVVGLDAPWFDVTALDYLVSASEWRIPIIALTSLVTAPMPGPVTFLPATTPLAEIVLSVEQAAALRGIRPSLPAGNAPN